MRARYPLILFAAGLPVSGAACRSPAKPPPPSHETPETVRESPKIGEGSQHRGTPGFREREGTRQIHLDFHTSEALRNVGGRFDKKQFQTGTIEVHHEGTIKAALASSAQTHI